MTINTQTIWEELSCTLQRFIQKRVSNVYDAEDILQNVFMKIHKHVPELHDEAKLRAWVFRITNNAIVDYYRSNKSGVEYTVLADMAADEIPFIDNVNHETAACAKAMLQHLPDKYREAITLTELINLPQKDVAASLGLSLSCTKSRVQRARKKLKEMLLDCCQFEFDRRGGVIDYKRKNNDCRYC
jgi:RNA polymerase sigma-70 factor (ECF subfamily)